MTATIAPPTTPIVGVVPPSARVTLGSFFSGFGGLDMAVEEVFDAETLWLSDIDPGACKVLNYRFPHIPNLGDITTIKWTPDCPTCGIPTVAVWVGDMGDRAYRCADHGNWPLDIATGDNPALVDMEAGGSPCFPAGTLVDTRDGYRPIEDIRVGDEVRTHRVRYMPVVQTMNRTAQTDAISIKVMGSPAFVTTDEHPFYVRTKRRVWDNARRCYVRTWSDPDWVAAGQLTRTHFVGYQIDVPSPEVEPIGEALAYVIGRWLGDGWLRTAARKGGPTGRRGSRVTSRWWQVLICCAHAEADRLAEHLEAANLRATRRKERTDTKFTVSSQALVKLLEGFGRGAHGKRVPGWVYLLPIAEQAAIWRGWVDSDGSTQPDGQIRVTTVSPDLAHGMARVARNAHRRAVAVHRFKVSSESTIEGRAVTQRDLYQVCLPLRNREAFEEDGWIWAPVRSVTPAGPVARVYNIGVKDDESYTAWGVTVHNCQDVSTAGARAGMVEGTRSNLWQAMREGIYRLQPALVVWENVAGVLSAKAASQSLPDHLDAAIRHHLTVSEETRYDIVRQRHRRAAVRLMESRQGHVGVPYPQPALRALGRVLGDMASLGFDAEWGGIQASDVGAPHGRKREFVLSVHPARARILARRLEAARQAIRAW